MLADSYSNRQLSVLPVMHPVHHKDIYRRCVLKSETIKTSCNINITNISDVQLLTSITEMVFGQTNMNNRDKKLSREYTEKIRSIMLEYINQKTLTDNQFKA